MKPKIARRVLRRMSIRVASHNMGVRKLSMSERKIVGKATEVLLREEMRK